MTTDNFCFYLQNRLTQTSQTGGQQYSDISPFSIPCFVYHFSKCCLLPLGQVLFCLTLRHLQRRRKLFQADGARRQPCQTSADGRRGQEVDRKKARRTTEPGAKVEPIRKYLGLRQHQGPML
jgi:hypothetical protein